MVQTLAVNGDNDIFLNTQGNISLISGIDAVLAACETATKAQLGEMVLAINKGIPNFQTLWVGSPNYALFQSYLKDTLLSVAGVLEVKSIELSSLDNVLSYIATIETEFGTVVVNG